jgi:leader peptidase (prepilin peptidase)/N-methyltransferase
MGFGDVTLMAMIGAALGPELALLTVFVGAAIGAFVFLFIVFPLSRLRAAPVSAITTSDGAVALPTVPPHVAAPPGDGTPEDTDSRVDSYGLPHVPFGVFLAPAALVTLLYGRQMIDLYLAYMARA